MATLPKPLDEDSAEKKFRTVNQTQESIQSLTLWVIHHKAHHEKIVDIWFRVLKKDKMPHRLTLFYLCNDIVQTCKRKHAIIYKDAFKDILKDAVLMVRDISVRNSVERIFKIWEERKVYDVAFLEELSAILNNTKVRATINSRLLAEFKPNDLINTVETMKKHDNEVEIRTHQLSGLRLDSSNVEAIKQLKDRSQGKEFGQEFEVSCTKLEKFVEKIEEGMKQRAALVELLEQSELFYDTQYGEAKIVANAYKNFGTRVNNLRKKLEEHKKALDNPYSPMPSPSMDAPSPGQTPPDEIASLDMELSVNEKKNIPGLGSPPQNSDEVPVSQPTDSGDSNYQTRVIMGEDRSVSFHSKSDSEESSPALPPWLQKETTPDTSTQIAAANLVQLTEGTTPTNDEGSSTPVQDEKPDTHMASNPIEFLTQLINQSQKNNVPQSSFFQNLQLLTSRVKGKGKTSEGGDGAADILPGLNFLLPGSTTEPAPPPWEPWDPQQDSTPAPSYVPDTRPTPPRLPYGDDPVQSYSQPYIPVSMSPSYSLDTDNTNVNLTVSSESFTGSSQPPPALQYGVDSPHGPPPAQPYGGGHIPPLLPTSYGGDTQYTPPLPDQPTSPSVLPPLFPTAVPPPPPNGSEHPHSTSPSPQTPYPPSFYQEPPPPPAPDTPPANSADNTYQPAPPLPWTHAPFSSETGGFLPPIPINTVAPISDNPAAPFLLPDPVNNIGTPVTQNSGAPPFSMAMPDGFPLPGPDSTTRSDQHGFNAPQSGPPNHHGPHHNRFHSGPEAPFSMPHSGNRPPLFNLPPALMSMHPRPPLPKRLPTPQAYDGELRYETQDQQSNYEDDHDVKRAHNEKALRGILRHRTSALTQIQTMDLDSDPDNGNEQQKSGSGGVSNIVTVVGRVPDRPSQPQRPSSKPPTPSGLGPRTGPFDSHHDNEDQQEFIDKLKRKSFTPSTPPAPPKGILKNLSMGIRNLRNLAEVAAANEQNTDDSKESPPVVGAPQSDPGGQGIETDMDVVEPENVQDTVKERGDNVQTDPAAVMNREDKAVQPHREPLMGHSPRRWSQDSPRRNDEAFQFSDHRSGPRPFRYGEPNVPRRRPPPPFDPYRDQFGRPFPKRGPPPFEMRFRPRFPRY